MSCSCPGCASPIEEVTCNYKPDYKRKCENCGQSPCVVAEYSDGSEDYEFEMCGPCTFGSAKCIDPEEW